MYNFHECVLERSLEEVVAFELRRHHIHVLVVDIEKIANENDVLVGFLLALDTTHSLLHFSLANHQNMLLHDLCNRVQSRLLWQTSKQPIHASQIAKLVVGEQETASTVLLLEKLCLPLLQTLLLDHFLLQCMCALF